MPIRTQYEDGETKQKNGENKNKNKTTIKTPNKNKRKIWGFTLIKRGSGLIRKKGSYSVVVITLDFENISTYEFYI